MFNTPRQESLISGGPDMSVSFSRSMQDAHGRSPNFKAIYFVARAEFTELTANKNAEHGQQLNVKDMSISNLIIQTLIDTFNIFNNINILIFNNITFPITTPNSPPSLPIHIPIPRQPTSPKPPPPA